MSYGVRAQGLVPSAFHLQRTACSAIEAGAAAVLITQHKV